MFCHFWYGNKMIWFEVKLCFLICYDLFYECINQKSCIATTKKVVQFFAPSMYNLLWLPDDLPRVSLKRFAKKGFLKSSISCCDDTRTIVVSTHTVNKNTALVAILKFVLCGVVCCLGVWWWVDWAAILKYITKEGEKQG